MADGGSQIRRGRKYDQVLAGACDVFLRDGFEGASVDEIAKCAGVSKATLYSYFPDKRLLFLEVGQCECRRQAAEGIDPAGLESPPAVTLRLAGEQILRLLTSKLGQQVFRLCVAESHRFPELGRRFWECGPGLIERSLGTYLEAACRRGELVIDDISLAAHQFAELCKAELVPRMIFGLQSEFTEAERTRVIDGAVETFLARYAPAT
ncbi:TetR/AcrR family transcriptional regulator [Palleronia sediminis]|uniref:TetR/AcrR family transcriptional regulator n=1 Tax=Palleronia sediminis TaxID=2547833 RepID=A0A4R6A6Q2_9RHOB|nr:TetR/AcrR family transcriptional regulator [Palleronia sediminis]TDL78404.1 TetR/AcrR family transcriptional regulator [Palleronia sediminis]